MVLHTIVVVNIVDRTLEAIIAASLRNAQMEGNSSWDVNEFKIEINHQIKRSKCMANHHYVSQFYYRNFASNPERSLVHAMDNEGNIINRPRSIRKISFEEDYNTEEQEQEQSRLETIYAETLREFIETPNPGNSDLSRDFVNFVSFLMSNNIYIREKLDEGFSEMEFQIVGAPGDHNISTHTGYKGRFDWSEAFAEAVYEEFYNWQFVRRETNGYEVFITSDDPVSILNPEDVRIPITANITWRDPRIANISDERTQISDDQISREVQLKMTLERISFGQDVVVVFPVTPSLCLIGFSDSDRHAKFLAIPHRNDNHIGFMNLITFAHCNERVYSHRQELLQQTYDNKQRFLSYCATNNLNPSLEVGVR